jgi:chitin disaccharide deacetylase
MRRLIVNADDFALTAGVNQAILDAHRDGIVTSTTLMANGAAFGQAVIASRRAPTLGVGVHLNLSEGVPISPPESIPTLVDDLGRLHLTPGRLLEGILVRHVDLREVETELRAQISRIMIRGIAPTHLDGHKHVHVLPGVDDIVIRLAREFAIPSVRCPLEEAPGLLNTVEAGKSAGGSVLRQYLVGRGISLFARRFRRKLADAGLSHPAHFHGISYTGFLNTRLIEDVVERLPEGTNELMCHPGYSDADLARTRTRLLVQREVEAFALCSPLIKRLVAGSGIRLVNYRALAGFKQSEAVAA